MAKIFVTGAGSAQSNGVVNCLLMDKDSGDEIVGLGSDQYDLMLCKSHKKILMPHSTKPEYKEKLLKVLNAEKPDMIHFQHDKELFIAENDEKEMLAGVLIFDTPLTVHTQYIANSDKGRDIGALDLVMDYLINEYAKNKKYFDFGTSNEENGKILNIGLVGQKQEFGGRGIIYDVYEWDIQG